MASFQNNDMLDLNSHLPDRELLIDLHSTFSEVPVCSDDISHTLLSLPFSASILPLPNNKKLCYCSQSLQAMIKT
jgi:hypothetical protein